MAQVIEKAKKRLASLEREAEQIRIFIHMYERLAAEEAAPQGAPQVAPLADSTMSPGPVLVVTKSGPAEIVAAAKDLMKEKQRPLTRTELVHLLTLRGLRIAGTDKSKNVGTIIWRSKQFENVEGKGYWAKDFGPWGKSEFNF